MSEQKQTREELIKLLEQRGVLVPDCKGCAVFYEVEDPTRVFAPRHRSSTSCKSGRRPHCECPVCWG